MGYKHSYDIEQAYKEIRAAFGELNNSRTDGFVAWGIKQDLYQLKWVLDNLIKDSTSFGSVESEWLKEPEAKKLINYLKD